MPSHFHHGAEEYLVVLRGRPTLRTGDGSRELAEGRGGALPPGPEGAHGLGNETDEPVRVLMASTGDWIHERSHLLAELVNRESVLVDLAGILHAVEALRRGAVC
jgi:uncharacterized cupin superfamily protein